MKRYKRALITGINGFAGTHLANYLNTIGTDVYGIDIDRESVLGFVDYQRVELPDEAGLNTLLGRVTPDHIYHLAAVSHPVEAGISPRRTFTVNLMGTVSLLDAVKKSSPESKVLLVGSAKEYGLSSSGDLLTEQAALLPADFYAVSKYVSELTGLLYVKNSDIDIRFTRSFNHTGPGQSHFFVCSDWARQIALIEKKGLPPQVRVGDLTPVLDFCDVRDVVRAYNMILESGKKGDLYNVCSSEKISLRSVLDYLCGKTEKKIETLEQESRINPHSHNQNIAGCFEKLRNQTGWEPQIPITKSLDDLFEFWMEKLSVA